MFWKITLSYLFNHDEGRLFDMHFIFLGERKIHLIFCFVCLFLQMVLALLRGLQDSPGYTGSVNYTSYITLYWVILECYFGVTSLLEWCYRGFYKVLQGSYRGVKRVLHGCFRGITRVSYRTLQVLSLYLRVLSLYFPGTFPIFLWYIPFTFPVVSI